MLIRAADAGRSSGRGFTLAEVVASLAILVIGAAVVLPSYAGHYNRQRAEDARGVLFALAMALANQQVDATTPTRTGGFLGFGYRVQKFPMTLGPLVRKLTANDKICATSTVSFNVFADTILWQGTTGTGNIPGTGGGWPPYTGLSIIEGKGVSTPLGWVHDSVIKGTSGASTLNYVELHMDSLSAESATYLDVAIDGTDNGAAGLLRYENSGAAGLKLIRFLIPQPSVAIPAKC